MNSSLFSMFDPCTSPWALFGVGKWVFGVVPLLLLGWGLFARPGGSSGMCVLVCKAFRLGLIQYSVKESAKGMCILLVSLFLIVFWWNEVGLFPFGFGVSSHLTTNLSMGLSLVLGGVVCMLMCSGWKSLLSHMVPYGSPLGLSFVLVLIETVSFMIRPFTLSIRLTGNMITGHLLVSLLCESGCNMMASGSLAAPLVLVLGVGLLMFETIVSLIQAAIFTILLFMYWTE